MVGEKAIGQLEGGVGVAFGRVADAAVPVLVGVGGAFEHVGETERVFVRARADGGAGRVGEGGVGAALLFMEVSAIGVRY